MSQKTEDEQVILPVHYEFVLLKEQMLISDNFTAKYCFTRLQDWLQDCLTANAVPSQLPTFLRMKSWAEPVIVFLSHCSPTPSIVGALEGQSLSRQAGGKRKSLMLNEIPIA